MGVGHIYQYFENKEAIMIALSERDFEDYMLHMAQLDRPSGNDVDSILKAFLGEIPWLLEYDRAALALEVLAEAGRNPKVAELVLRIDDRFRHTMRKTIEPVLEGLNAKEVDARVEMLLVMTRALAVHAGTHPVSDPEVIAAGLRLALMGMLAQPQYASDNAGSQDNSAAESGPR